MSEEWKFQRKLTNIRWEPEEFIDKIEKVCEFDSEKAFLFTIIYLAGARLGEVLSISEGEETRPAFRWNDIWYEKVGKDRWDLILNVRVLKRDRNKKVSLKWTRRRLVRIPLKKDRYDFPLVEFVGEYLVSVGWNKGMKFYVSDSKISNSEENPFTNLSASWLMSFCNKHLECNCHYLRHLRFGHLSNIDKLTPQMLQKIGDWKSGDMCLHYSQATQNDIMDKMWQRDNK